MAVSRGVLAIAGMVAACWSASAAELTTTVSRQHRTIVALNGALAHGDASRFKELLKAAAAEGRPVSAVRLNSPGGSMAEGEKLADIIQRTKIATVIASGATCSGACFIPFIAGDEKFVSATATVSVPGAAEKSDDRPSASMPVVIQVKPKTPAIVRVVQKLGLLDAIITKMRETQKDEVAPLTIDDLRAMGATMTGKPARPR